MNSIQVPDGYFYEGFTVWGALGEGGIIGRGYVVEFPDLSASDPQAYLDLEKDLRMILSRVGSDERIQFQFFTSGEFGNDLGTFEAKTANARSDIVRSVRTELVERYRKRMESDHLIRSNVRIFISTRIEKLETNGKRIRGFENMFQVVKRSFASHEMYIRMLVRRYGGSLSALDNTGHRDDLAGFWSPASLHLSPSPDWLSSIQELTQFSEVGYRAAPDHGLCIDGYYVGVLVFKSLPRKTRQTTMDPFLNLAIPGLRVVVNARPLSVETEMQFEQGRFSKLMSNVSVEHPSLESEVGLGFHRSRMERLMSSETVPFAAQIIAVVSARTATGLDERMEAVRLAVSKTASEAYRPMVPTTVLGYYNRAVPGIGAWIPYADYEHKIDDLNLANLLPTGSSPCADLSRADWIFDNDVNGLMGGRFFAGPQPLNALVLGAVGTGKSALTQALMLQAVQFKLIAVIDNGASYNATCRRLDPRSRPFVISSHGGQTFNVFDTDHHPLLPDHINAATSLCHLVAGRSSDEDRDKLRHAVLAEAIDQLYGTAFRRWRNNQPEAHFDVCMEVAAVQRVQSRMDPTSSFYDALDLWRQNPDTSGIDHDFALALGNDPEAEHLVRSLAVARWTPEMFPTLSKLVDHLYASSIQRGPNQEICSTLATLIRPWLRGGSYGQLLDGPSNFSLVPEPSDGVQVIHIELGLVAKHQPELLAVAGFLIINHLQNLIMTMRRDDPKMIVFEELSSLLAIPNGAEFVAGFYQTMRKYMCLVAAVAQQFGSILAADERVARAIIGNVGGVFLLRNQNRRELDDFGKFVHLPESVKDRVQRFALPSDMQGMPDAHSGFVFISLEAEKRYTVGKSILTDEVEFLTSSTGADYEKKKESNAKIIDRAA
jgi:type IV secretion system protein TrbE